MEEKLAFDEDKKERKRRGKKRNGNGDIQAEAEDADEGNNEAAINDHGDNETTAVDDDLNIEAQMFHRKTQVVDTITPEALILTLYHGSGNIVIKSDEFKVIH